MFLVVLVACRFILPRMHGFHDYSRLHILHDHDFSLFPNQNEGLEADIDQTFELPPRMIVAARTGMCMTQDD